jgi:probable F420-dependent oxidoreductase
MHVGVTMFTTDRSMRPDELAREVEARGFESLFFPEHTHIPVSRRTPYPMGGELPEEYHRTYDLFVAMTAAASATSTLVVGSGICLVAQRDPIVTAKEVASLDQLSGGRLVFGVGFGWNEDEMEDHGVDPRRRRSIAREKVLAMKALWGEDEAGFEGEHVRVAPSWMWPKPVQRPHPPIFIGGAGGATLFRHVAEYADGWMPIGGSGVRQSLPELQRAVEDAGRDPASIKVMIFSAAGEPGRLEYYASLGFERTVIGLPSAPAGVVLPLLDRHAELLAQVA